jgi:hypothetical protein
MPEPRLDVRLAICQNAISNRFSVLSRVLRGALAVVLFVVFVVLGPPSLRPISVLGEVLVVLDPNSLSVVGSASVSPQVPAINAGIARHDTFAHMAMFLAWLASKVTLQPNGDSFFPRYPLHLSDLAQIFDRAVSARDHCGKARFLGLAVRQQAT